MQEGADDVSAASTPGSTWDQSDGLAVDYGRHCRPDYKPVTCLQEGAGDVSAASTPGSTLDQSDSLAFEPGGLAGPRDSIAGAGALINQPNTASIAGIIESLSCYLDCPSLDVASHLTLVLVL